MKIHLLIFSTFAATLLVATTLRAETPPVYWKWASTPPMGWNSCDSLGTSITGDDLLANGTDPNDPASVFKITQVAKSGNDMLVSFSTVAGKMYRMECSATLQTGSWTTVQDNIAGTGSVVQIPDVNGAAQPRRFYRVALK